MEYSFYGNIEALSSGKIHFILILFYFTFDSIE